MARQVALRRLAGAPQTRGQLAAAMARRGVPEPAAEAVLDRFEEVGLVDDRAYARAWVESRHAGRGLARRALAHELRGRGVDPVLVDEAVASLDPADERRTARALVDARLPATRGLPVTTRVRRLAGMLARKGYAEGLALAVVREALEQERTEEPDGPQNSPT